MVGEEYDGWIPASTTNVTTNNLWLLHKPNIIVLTQSSKLWMLITYQTHMHIPPYIYYIWVWLDSRSFANDFFNRYIYFPLILFVINIHFLCAYMTLPAGGVGRGRGGCWQCPGRMRASIESVLFEALAANYVLAGAFTHWAYNSEKLIISSLVFNSNKTSYIDWFGISNIYSSLVIYFTFWILNI